MMKSPTNGAPTTKWKEITYIKQHKGKKNTMSKTSVKKGSKTNKYDRTKGISVKKEEMQTALVNRCPSPKRKRDNSTEIIVLDDNSDIKMTNKNNAELSDEVVSIKSSEEDEILNKLPKPRRKKERRFVNFMDFDTEDENEDMKSVEDGQDADEQIAKNTKIVETENPEFSNDNEISGKLDKESDNEDD